MIELRPSQAGSQLISFTCLAMGKTQGATHLSENLFIKAADFGKTMFFFATLDRKSNCSKCDYTLLSLLAPDLKSEHRRILAIFPFILTTLYPCVRIERKIVHASEP